MKNIVVTVVIQKMLYEIGNCHGHIELKLFIRRGNTEWSKKVHTFIEPFAEYGFIEMMYQDVREDDMLYMVVNYYDTYNCVNALQSNPRFKRKTRVISKDWPTEISVTYNLWDVKKCFYVRCSTSVSVQESNA